MEGGYDPSLYASTGSWAGMPYDAPSYGGYAPAYAPGPAPVQYAQPYAPMPARPAYGGGPMYGGYAEPAPYYPPPYGGGYGGGGYAPRGRRGPPIYDMPYMDGPPPGPPRQKVYGVGILFAERMDAQGGFEVVVKDVYADAPAAASGRIKPGDVLTTVSGKNVQGFNLRQLRGSVPGPLGSVVNLGFEGASGPYDVDVERVQSNRGANTVYGGGGNPMYGGGGNPGNPGKPRAPPPPKSTEGMAYVGFSVQADSGEFAVANVTADSTADQKGLKQGDRISAIDGKKLQGMHEEEVKQMLIGEPFSPVSITAGEETIEIERDCAVPEPEVGGPIVGGAMEMPPVYNSYGAPPTGMRGYPMPAQYPPMPPMYAPSYAPPRAYEMNAPASPVMNGLPPFSPATAPSYAPVTQSYPIQYAQHPVQYGPPMGAPRGGAMAPGPPPGYAPMQGPPPGFAPMQYVGGPPMNGGGPPMQYGAPMRQSFGPGGPPMGPPMGGPPIRGY